MFWLQYGLKNKVYPVGMNVDGVWITDGKLVINRGPEYDKEELLLSDIKFVNFEETITRNEVKQLDLESKLYELRDQLTVLSERQAISIEEWHKEGDVRHKYYMINYYEGVKNGIDLAIVKINEILGALS